MVIFKGTADLFYSRHFISLYRPTSELFTVEGKAERKREGERVKKKRAISRSLSLSLAERSGADSSARISFLHVESRRKSTVASLVGSDNFLFPFFMIRGKFPANATDDALMTVA